MKRLLLLIGIVLTCFGCTLVGCSDGGSDDVRVIRDAELPMDGEPPAHLALAMELFPATAKSLSVTDGAVFAYRDEADAGTDDTTGFEDMAALLGVKPDAVRFVAGVSLEDVDGPAIVLEGNIDGGTVVKSLDESSARTETHGGVAIFHVQGEIWQTREDIGPGVPGWCPCRCDGSRHCPGWPASDQADC